MTLGPDYRIESYVPSNSADLISMLCSVFTSLARHSSCSAFSIARSQKTEKNKCSSNIPEHGVQEPGPLDEGS